MRSVTTVSESRHVAIVGIDIDDYDGDDVDEGGDDRGARVVDEVRAGLMADDDVALVEEVRALSLLLLLLLLLFSLSFLRFLFLFSLVGRVGSHDDIDPPTPPGLSDLQIRLHLDRRRRGGGGGETTSTT